MRFISISSFANTRLYRALFLCLLIVVFAASFFDTFSHKTSTSRAATVSLHPSVDCSRYGIDPFYTEFDVILSETVLAEAAANLNLSQEWGAKYNHGVTLDKYRVIDRLRNALTLRRYNAMALEIRARDESPEEAARIANEVASIYCQFHSRNSNTPDFATVSVASLATSQGEEVHPLRVLRFAFELCAGILLAAVVAFGAVTIPRFVSWVLAVEYPITLRGVLCTNPSGKIVGALWAFVGAALGLFGFGFFALACWHNRSLVLLPLGIVGGFWLLNSIAGFFLARNHMGARVFIIVAGGIVAFVPAVTKYPYLLFFDGQFVWFGIGSICALLLPQKTERFSQNS